MMSERNFPSFFSEASPDNSSNQEMSMVNLKDHSITKSSISSNSQRVPNPLFVPDTTTNAR